MQEQGECELARKAFQLGTKRKVSKQSMSQKKNCLFLKQSWLGLPGEQMRGLAWSAALLLIYPQVHQIRNQLGQALGHLQQMWKPEIQPEAEV